MVSKHNTSRVFVLDKYKRPLMPCHPARARKLLRNKKAAVYRLYPFTIILLNRTLEESILQPIELRIDPGSKTTGISIVAMFNNKPHVIWAAHIIHRGHIVTMRLKSRAAIRRGRRNRKTRYRKPKYFKLRSKLDSSGKTNSSNKKGWLPPSLRSRINNTYNLTLKLLKYVPFDYIAVESVSFDTSSITAGTQLYGKEYNHGTLFGYTIKQYLLEVHNHTCVYCGATSVPLEIEHIIPKSRGGSNNISNLTISCTICNRRKSNKTASEFGYNLNNSNIFLKDMAAVNSTKEELVKLLQSTGLEVNTYDAALTKFNRKRMNYVKDHWLDASCVGPNPALINSTNFKVLTIEAKGRGHRQVQTTDKFGFPKRKPKGGKRLNNLQTGDIINITMPKHSKYAGYYTHVPIIGVRFKNNNIDFQYGNQKITSANLNYCKIKTVHRADGYDYYYN